MKFFLSIASLLLFLSSVPTFSQTAISGKVVDHETQEELIMANVVVTKNGNYIIGTSSDFDGNYSIELEPGKYDVEASYVGYPPHRIEGVIVEKDQNTSLDIELQYVYFSYCPGIVSYPIELIDQDPTHSGVKIDKNEIYKSTVKAISELIFKAPGVTTLRF